MRLKHLEKLTDKQPAATAKEITAEEKRRANLKAAASAILRVLSKYRLSLRDLTVLDLGQKPTARAKKKPVGKKAALWRQKRHPPRNPISATKFDYQRLDKR